MKKASRPELPVIPTVSSSNYVRFCVRGEKLTDDKSCELCTEQTYSFVDYPTKESFKEKTICQPCASEATCLDGYKVGPNPGYWRFDLESPNLIPCWNDEACLGREINIIFLWNSIENSFKL